MGKIVFEALEFYAYHGVFAEEQKIGARYLVDLELEVDFTSVIITDNIEATIDYSKIYNVIAVEMNKKSKLIEHVAGRIVSMLFVSFKKIDWIKIKLTKLNPPIKGDVKSVSVVIEKARLEK